MTKNAPPAAPPPPPPTKKATHDPFEHVDKVINKGYQLVIAKRFDDQIGASFSRDGAAAYNSVGLTLVDALNNLENFLRVSEVP
jgi:hypothetical protein